MQHSHPQRRYSSGIWQVVLRQAASVGAAAHTEFSCCFFVFFFLLKIKSQIRGYFPLFFFFSSSLKLNQTNLKKQLVGNKKAAFPQIQNNLTPHYTTDNVSPINTGLDDGNPSSGRRRKLKLHIRGYHNPKKS